MDTFRILVVDDESSIRNVITDFLDTLEFRSTAAENGSKAIEHDFAALKCFCSAFTGGNIGESNADIIGEPNIVNMRGY